MAQSRFFSSVAQPTTLAGTISSTAVIVPVLATTGFPSSFPYTIALDYGTSIEELCDVTSAASLNLTVVRAVDSTSSAIHNVGAAVRHVSSARDFNEDNAHVNSATGVHGIAGGSSVVGTTDVQTLSNKTLTSPILTSPTLSAVTIGTTGTGTVNLTAQQNALQTAASIQTKANGGAVLFETTSNGFLNLNPNTTTFTDALKVTSPAGTVSTNNLLNLVNNATSVFNVTAGGNATLTGTVTATTVAATGNVTAAGNVVATGTLGGSALTQATISSVTSARKTTDFVMTSNTVLAADGELAIAVTAAGKYRIDALLEYLGPGPSTADVKIRVNYTGTISGAFIWTTGAPIIGSNNTANSATFTAFATATMGTFSSSQSNMARVSGYLTATGPGNFTFEFAQNTSNATPCIVRIGSYSSLTKLS